MTEPLQLRGIQERLSAEQKSISSGVMQAVLMHALQLRRSFREVFLLCDIQRHSVSEAAAILGISRTAANRRLLLARRRMGEVIESLCGKQQAEHFEIKANVEESCKSGAEGGI
jgi:DNA-directed RNA polymerase specialized sigma24 family protein